MTHTAEPKKRLDGRWQARCPCGWNGDLKATRDEANEEAAAHDILKNRE